MEDRVILVDENDQEIGTEEKMQAHIDAKLHRAFSIYIFNSKGELLLHQRAKEKYHCGGLWTNTCCSHPRQDESLEDATKRRLREEMGMGAELKKILNFIYKKSFSNGLTEHEHLHVFIGKSDKDPNPDPEEAEDWKWINIKELKEDIKNNPEKLLKSLVLEKNQSKIF